MPRKRAVLCLTLFLLASCGPGWHRVEMTPTPDLDPLTQYLVHHGAVADRWHALRITSDSVSGVSFLKPIECDSCRMAIPLASVDSIREGHPTAGLLKGAGVVLLGPFVLMAALCILSGDDAGCWVPPET